MSVIFALKKKKKKKQYFSISNKVSKAPFDLIDVDIRGPFSQQSTNGSHYFLTIVDDFSRYTWIHLMYQSFKLGLLFNLSLNFLQHGLTSILKP
jgi:hypothetical protein